MSRPALLFDLDGTLIETDPLHAAVFIALFAERGREIDTAYYVDHIHGRLNEDIFGEMFPGEDAAALADEKEARFRQRLGSSAEPMPGALALLDWAEAMGWGVAAVTNAPRANAEAMLSAIGLTHRFAHLVVGDECDRGKPHPDPYQVAMSLLGASAERAIAFEDSASGVASAAAAGTTVIGLRSTLGHDALIEAGATDSIADFSDDTLAPYLDRLGAPSA